MKKIFIYSFDCEKRLLDAKRIKRYFKKNDYVIINNPKKADIIIFFTCAIFNEIAEKLLKKISKYKKYKGELIVAGCLPAIKEEELKKIFNGRIIPTKNLENIDYYFPNHKVKFKDIDDGNTFFVNYDNSKIGDLLKQLLFKIKLLNFLYEKLRRSILKMLFGGKSLTLEKSKNKLFYIRISRGCPNNCSYCTIKRAVGKLKSKKIETIVDEFKKGLEKNYKIFRLVADDAGSYGLDIERTLPNLLNRLVKIQGDYKIIIGGLNPKWAIKYKDEIKKILKSKKIIKIDIPIQSASKRLLKLMNRYSDIKKIKSTLREFKKIYPDLCIESHFIIGFPSETWKDFRSSLEFIKKHNIDSGFILKYSNDRKTESAKINQKTSSKDKIKRIKYSKKFLKKSGYIVTYIPKRRNLRFDKYNI